MHLSDPVLWVLYIVIALFSSASGYFFAKEKYFRRLTETLVDLTEALEEATDQKRRSDGSSLEWFWRGRVDGLVKAVYIVERRNSLGGEEEEI